MKFRTEKKVTERILPKYPETTDFCCTDLEKAFRGLVIQLSLSDKLRCVLNVNAQPIIYYCPFCGTKFEFEKVIE